MCDDNNELAISFADHSVRLLISFSLFSRLQKATYTCDENNEMATSFLTIVFVCTSVFRPTIVCKGLLLRFNPRPAGPLDFPPPAGGGAFERPPHDLGSWSP